MFVPYVSATLLVTPGSVRWIYRYPVVFLCRKMEFYMCVCVACFFWDWVTYCVHCANFVSFCLFPRYFQWFVVYWFKDQFSSENQHPIPSNPIKLREITRNLIESTLNPTLNPIKQKSVAGDFFLGQAMEDAKNGVARSPSRFVADRRRYRCGALRGYRCRSEVTSWGVHRIWWLYKNNIH